MKRTTLLILLSFCTAFAQEPTEENKSFQSLMSLGYTPKTNANALFFTFINSGYKSSASIQSGKLYDEDAVASTLNATYMFGISDSTNLFIGASNTFSKTIKDVYTANGISLGYSDTSTNKSGMNDPRIGINTTLKENSNLKITGGLFYSPSIGVRKTESDNSGGASVGANVAFCKAFGNSEIKVLASYTSQGLKKGESTNFTYETKGNNELSILGSFNHYFRDTVAFTFSVGRNQYDSTSTTYSNTTNEFKGDPTATTSVVGGIQYELDKNMIFGAALTSVVADESNATVGSTKFTFSKTTATGFTLGVGFSF